MKHMSRHPEKTKFLQGMRVLVIDEFCQVVGQTLLSIDMVLREVSKSAMAFGGVCVF